VLGLQVCNFPVLELEPRALHVVRQVLCHWSTS
jgi:hypothetical protein